MSSSQIPAQRLYTDCPTPKKSRFATIEAAEAAATRAQFELDKTLYPYDTCPCGWVHLTSKKQRVNETPLATRVAELGDEAFMQLVQEDVKKTVHPSDAVELRHPENLFRWRNALRQFRRDLEKQLADKVGLEDEATKEWRRRVTVVRLAVATAYDECTSLINQVRIENTERKQAEREQRHEAGERAIDRLISAHQIEFQRYLQEECEALGVELPKRIRRYLELEDLKETPDA